MYNNLFTIGSYTIHTYGLMLAIAILAAYFTAEYRARKNNLDDSKIFGLFICCIIPGFVFAKIFYWLTILPSITADPSILLRTISDGWVIYGGVIGGVLGAVLYCKKTKIPTLKYFDLGIASVSLAQGIGRIGCFFAGCCYGVETESSFSIVFTNSQFAPNDVQLIPTQLISSALNFLLFAFLVYLYRRKEHVPGQCMAAYLLCYSVGRFIVEFLRGDDARGFIGEFSTAQFIAIFTFAAGTVLLTYVHVRGNIYDIEKKAALFDLDGTLLDTLDSIARPTNAALKEFGYEERPIEEYKVYVGDGYEKSVTKALAASGETDPEKISEVYELGRKLYAEDPTYNVKIYPGIEDAITKLKENGLKLAVITNKPHVSAPAVIEEFFGKETFDVVKGQEDGKPNKPDPECVTDVLDEFGVKPEECYYFGDSDTDMKFGKAANFYTVGVTWGFRSQEELEENGADLIIHDPSEITELV